MKKKFFTPYSVLLFFALVLGAGGWGWWQILNQHISDSALIIPEAIETTLKKSTQLMVSESGRETVTLKAGERIKILARHGKDQEFYFLAETSDGKRGVIADPDQNYAPDYVFDYKEGGYRMSTSQFYEECIGKSFDEFDGKYSRAVFVPVHPNNTKSVTIQMPFILRDTDSWKACIPLVTYTDGVATEIQFRILRKGNRLFLRFAPFAGWLLEDTLVQQIISKPQFVKYEPARAKDFWYYFDIFVDLIKAIVYLGLFGSMPLFVFVMYLLYAPKNWRGRTAFNICISVVLIALAYLWLLVVMMEGYKWWYVWFPNFIFLFFNIAIFAISLDNQCPYCKHIGTLDKIKSEHTGQEFQESIKEEEVYRTQRSRERGKILETTYRHSPHGGSEVVKQRVKDGWIDVKQGWSETEVYKVKDRIDYYHSWYRCAKCERTHERDESVFTMISKELIGKKYGNSYTEKTIRR